MPNSTDDRLQVARSYLESYRHREDQDLITFWQQKIDRLLDEKLAEKDLVNL